MTLTAILALSIGSASEAMAAKDFYCKAMPASIGDGSPTHPTGPHVYDLGTTGSCTDIEYATQFNKKCEGPANSKCSGRAQYDAKFNDAAFWCAKGVPNNSVIRAYAAVGYTGKYNAAQTKGTLVNIPAQTTTTYDCNGVPGTWLDKPSQGNGFKARCVKTACNAVAGVPPVPAWVSIGSNWASSTGPAWVSDDKGNVWYGVPANAKTVVVAPATCKWK
jgi:hypothetical protein